VGLSGLEPLTSALSGQRSNRLSYRPSCWEMPVRAQIERLSDPERTPQISCQSSASVTSRPPSMVAARLYRNDPSVASAVKITTSTQAMSAVTPITF
jgi:hypothetical protein